MLNDDSSILSFLSPIACFKVFSSASISDQIKVMVQLQAMHRLARTAAALLCLLLLSAARANPVPPPGRPDIRVERDEHGAVTSQSADCSRIGIDVMKDGGNAVDAVGLFSHPSKHRRYSSSSLSTTATNSRLVSLPLCYRSLQRRSALELTVSDDCTATARFLHLFSFTEYLLVRAVCCRSEVDKKLFQMDSLLSQRHWRRRLRPRPHSKRHLRICRLSRGGARCRF